MNIDQRLYIERSLAAQLSKQIQPPKDHDEWTNSGFTFRVLVHYDKIFVVWKQGSNGPQILGKFRVSNFDLGTYDGIGVYIESDAGEAIDGGIWVGHTPTRLFGLPVFAHVPFISEVTFTPNGHTPEKFVVRLPVVFKTQSNPAEPKPGDIYVTQIGEFRGSYPEFAGLKL